MEPLVSAEEFAGHLQRDLDRFSAEQALAGASGFARDYCRWGILEEETTWTLDGTGTSLLSLPTLYLTDVAEVRIDGTVIAAPAAGAAPASDQYTWSEKGLLARAAGWPKRYRCIEVDVVHGYPLAQVPEAIKAVVMVIAARSMVNPEGLRSKTVGAVSKSYIFETMRGDLTELQIAQLGRYRLP